uniref:Threonylcarbamoyl-AMP synthase n=1 Tax=Romanomermis culicivorax TaxID=13658 RepID=A0A915IHC7_ROMCU
MLRAMVKQILKLDKTNFEQSVQRTIDCLSKNKVAAVPTDTIYGLTSMVTNSDLLYKIKERSGAKPIALCVGDISDFYIFSKVTVSETLLRALLPGPVTLIFERTSALPEVMNPNSDTIGIRIPDHPFMIELCRRFQPLALTSANISDGSSCLKIEEFENIWPKIDLIIDGGAIPETNLSRYGSTVVDLSIPGQYKIVRNGSALKQTAAVLIKEGLTERQ